jgi:hypothetical protein
MFAMRVLAHAPANVSVRPFALPAEHGAWGFLLEPLALALLVAPSVGGLAVGVAAVAALFARHPLRFAAADWMRGRRYPRTEVCERLGIAYAGCAAIALIVALRHGGAMLLVPLLVAAPLALAQFVADVRNRGRALAPEIAGVVAMAALAASVSLAANASPRIAITLSAIMLLRSIPSIAFVRSILHGASRGPSIALHVVAVAAAITAAPAAIAGTLLLLGRAIFTRTRVARTIGMRELAFGVAFVLLTAIAA